MVRLGRGLWLFEFENPKEADQVLVFGKRRCGGNLLHLRKWGHDIGYLSHGDLEEKAWLRVVGLPVHLCSRKVLKKIGDACGGLLAVDENPACLTDLTDLLWARILVRLGDETPPKTVEVVVGGCSFSIQLLWDINPLLEMSPKKRNGTLSSGEDDGETRSRERVGLRRRETVKAASAIGNGGVMWEKSPDFSIQTHRP